MKKIIITLLSIFVLFAFKTLQEEPASKDTVQNETKETPPPVNPKDFHCPKKKLILCQME